MIAMCAVFLLFFLFFFVFPVMMEEESRKVTARRLREMMKKYSQIEERFLA